LKKAICFITILLFLTAIFPILTLAYGQTQPSVSLTPSTYAATSVGQTFEVDLTISNVTGLWGWTANITWDVSYLNLTSVKEGSFLTSQVGATLFFNTAVNSSRGWCQLNDASLSTSAANGSGILAALHFVTNQRCPQTTITSNIILEGALSANATEGTAPPQITPISGTSQTTVTIHTGAPPTANAGPNRTVPKGTTVVFNASQSVSEGNNLTYTWTFTDKTQQTLTGMIASYFFNNPGTFNVELTVQDSIGTGTSNATIIVTNETLTPISIVISGVTPGSPIPVGQDITFEVDNSTLRSVPIKNCLWEMGDNTEPKTTTNPVEEHAYSSAGTYNVTVTIYYTDGVDQTGSKTVTIGQTSSTSTPSTTAQPGTSANPTYSSSPTLQAQNDQSLAIPSTVLAILIGVTAFIMVGSVLWLRRTVTNPEKN